MKPIAPFLLSLAFGLDGSSTVARAGTPIASIATATYDQYRDQYTPSPLCSGDEVTLWRCETGRKAFALCSSKAATRTTGYLEYRAGSAGKVTFAYPATRQPPAGLFKYTSYGNGNAAVEFTNDGYAYTLMDPLRDRSSIEVQAPGPAGKRTTIACAANQTLQVNYTMRLMHDFGIRADD
jgi:hypothetical protein